MDTNDKGREEDDFFLEMNDDNVQPSGHDLTQEAFQEAGLINEDHETLVTQSPEVEPIRQHGADVNEPTMVLDLDDVAPAAPAEPEADLSSTAAAIQAELNEVKSERDKYKDQLIRKAADLDNYRKRVARERDDQKRYGNEKFAQELLPVVDNMERALHAISADEANSPLKDGVDMVYKQLIGALKRFGVESFESKGTPFDPQKHEAIQQVENDDVESGTIIDEFQKGYFIYDRLLRPAMVSVAKNSDS